VIGASPAERILRRLGITEPQEIDLEATAWDLGVRIRYRPLTGARLGLLAPMTRLS
jgi:hypothetical protein